jgi:hypothetical protein
MILVPERPRLPHTLSIPSLDKPRAYPTIPAVEFFAFLKAQARQARSTWRELIHVRKSECARLAAFTVNPAQTYRLDVVLQLTDDIQAKTLIRYGLPSNYCKVRCSPELADTLRVLVQSKLVTGLYCVHLHIMSADTAGPPDIAARSNTCTPS